MNRELKLAECWINPAPKHPDDWFSTHKQEGWVRFVPEPGQEPAPLASGGAGGNWEGAEEWMPLAWALCAEECGEEACTELVWEGGPIPEPWGDRWLKYEDEAKRLIALVRKCLPTPNPQPVALVPLTPEEVLECVRDAAKAGNNMLKLTREVGPYEITEPTHSAQEVASRIQRALAAKNGATLAGGEG